MKDGPTIHFAVRSDAEERIHMGPALCKAGMAHRNENEQYVAGNWEFVTCKTCHRLLAAHNKREDEDDAKHLSTGAEYQFRVLVHCHERVSPERLARALYRILDHATGIDIEGAEVWDGRIGQITVTPEASNSEPASKGGDQ